MLFDTLDNGNVRISLEALTNLAMVSSAMDEFELAELLGLFVAYGEFNSEDANTVANEIRRILSPVAEKIKARA